MIGISFREFARRERCNDKLVRVAITKGRLETLPDGTLDEKLVGTGWRKSNRKSAPADTADKSAPKLVKQERIPKRSPKRIQIRQPEPGSTESLEEFTKRIIAEGGAPFTQGEAERIKENYLALLRQLEYDMKSGAVVLVSDIAKKVGDEYAKVRTKLLAIPAEQAPRLHRCKTTAELQDILRGILVRALEELILDRSGAAN